MPAISEICGAGGAYENNSRIAAYAPEATSNKNATDPVGSGENGDEPMGEPRRVRRAVTHAQTIISTAIVKSIASDVASKLEKLKRPRPLVAKQSGHP